MPSFGTLRRSHSSEHVVIHLLQDSLLVSLALYPGLPMFFSVACIAHVAREESGRPSQLCDVMMTCGHYLGHGLKSPPTRPCTYYEHTDDLSSHIRKK